MPREIKIIQYRTIACRTLAKGDCTHRHNQVAYTVHQELTIKCGLSEGPPVSYCKYELQQVLES
jgi:hypothetical protein